MDFADYRVRTGGLPRNRGDGLCSVAIRITTKTDGKTRTVRVEGRLTAVEVPDLRKECQSTDALVRVDLSGLRSADSTGITLLQSLSAEGTELYGASAFIRELLAGSSK